ncbi:5-formyltetrahydrofolate cyclo-ligase [Pigmentiphaga litoralis]|uniref:5-formyltetrahydrofolate cyclo-ligase n=1 Tax=Pigmentiphaga litoralis TaxID=516702 RepID=UPI00227D960A|nr:5-formyltetrahydrofolate cyclo-ligase [Pigmentiphaga litoralis]
MAGRIASGKPQDGDPAEEDRNGAPAQQKAGSAASDTAAATAPGLRAGLRAARTAMGPAARAAADARLAQSLAIWTDAWLANRRARGLTRHAVAAFWPIGSEPDLRGLYTHLASLDGVTLALPVVARQAAPLLFRRWSAGGPMASGAYGIPEPDGDAVPAPDLVLVPLLGFTDEADRIGYGGGYYDRTLADWRARGLTVTTIGVAYACGRLAPGTHAPEPHDVRLDAVATDAGWVPTAPPVPPAG